MIKVGITGSKGFVGTHLTNYLSLQPGVEIIYFDRSFFDDTSKMEKFVLACDTIVHLAGLNRHNDPDTIYETNIALCQKLVDACITAGSKPHVIFSSSTQEEKDTVYGHSKKQGRLILEQWAHEYGAVVTSAIIPNVFGPFGHPFYNSVVATFCHQLTHGETPIIQQDGILHLIYVNQLVGEIYGLIQHAKVGKVEIQHQFTISVSELLSLLTLYRDTYLAQGVFPDLSLPLHLALYNTFRCYIEHGHYPVRFKVNEDDRGQFVEIARTNTSGQFSYSNTKPGITRGNHFHTRKAERFAVIKGKAKISLRRIDTNDVIDYFLDGDTPAYVDMPIWHSHNITNIGAEELVTMFWINEPYSPENPDTYMLSV